MVLGKNIKKMIGNVRKLLWKRFKVNVVSKGGKEVYMGRCLDWIIGRCFYIGFREFSHPGSAGVKQLVNSHHSLI